MTPYERLTARFTRIATLGEASAMLGWDAAAMMPAGGAEARGEQMATLAGLAHELLTDPAVAADLADAAAQGDARGDASGDAWDAADLDLMREAHLRATALPRDLVEARIRANSACETIWREARPAGDFARVKDALGEVVRLAREEAVILGARLDLSAYDALACAYQRGTRAARIEPIFARYEAFLRDALPRAEERARTRPAQALPEGPYAAAVQESLCRRIAQDIGLDFARARLDRSAHPFCGGTPSDIRITTRYDEEDFCSALMGVVHETGHALYEQHLPKRYRRRKVGEAAGMAAHESQSLIVEMQACRSDAYLGYLAPLLSETFGRAITADGLRSRLRRVGRSFIRVEADELTYPAHVILRFRLERALIAGDLAVADLPGAWNDELHALLGITPPNDRLGCLQDIHWYDGALGYFPSYTLGAMAAAQLMQAARAALANLDADLARGDLSGLTAWLATNVHAHGARLAFDDLLTAATGKPLDADAFEAHLTRRYLD
jgi:carboxypeptidase Taq